MTFGKLAAIGLVVCGSVLTGCAAPGLGGSDYSRGQVRVLSGRGVTRVSRL